MCRTQRICSKWPVVGVVISMNIMTESKTGLPIDQFSDFLMSCCVHTLYPVQHQTVSVCKSSHRLFKLRIAFSFKALFTALNIKSLIALSPTEICMPLILIKTLSYTRTKFRSPRHADLSLSSLFSFLVLLKGRM